MEYIKRINIKLLIAGIAALVFLLALNYAPIMVDAADLNKTDICGGADLSVTGGSCEDTSSNINDIMETVINIFSIVVGFISVVMIIVGGLKYIMSGGESSNISGAKNTILYAIIGLVIVALAQIIVRFVLTKVNNP